jgi:hypothetical protein
MAGFFAQLSECLLYFTAQKVKIMKEIAALLFHSEAYENIKTFPSLLRLSEKLQEIHSTFIFVLYI